MGGNTVPDTTSYLHTVEVFVSELKAITLTSPPSNDHTNDSLGGLLHWSSLATPPVWISQMIIAVLEAQARECPSGE